MKVRWREQELVVVTIFAAAQIIIYSINLYNPGPYEVNYASGFKTAGIDFINWRNVFIPQAGAVLLVYMTYLSVNRIILPLVRKISFADFEKLFTINIIGPLLAIAVTGFLLATGINVVSFYGRPHLFNYGGYQIPALFGYNDAPLTNLFFGVKEATWFVATLLLLAGVRELIIRVIEKPGTKREFRVSVTNNIIPLIFIYFLVLIILNPLHETFIKYLSWITPVVFLYIYQTFWLFPLKKDQPFFNRPFVVHWLIATFIAAFPTVILLRNSHPWPQLLTYWTFLLIIITPLSWLLYQQRKDKIIQLRGMETALAKSTADLQFLRSQINPHFLFNALNTLYGTALHEKSEHTAAGIQMLGDMMRFMLHENHQDFIPMDRETEYLKNYIALQKLRTQSSPDIVIDDQLPEANCNQSIAPMLLIPFVENAFKHGISLKERSWISIRLACSGNQIIFEVKNSIHIRSKTPVENDESGIGLRNVAERLNLIYPERHTLIIDRTDNEFSVRLVIESLPVQI